MTAYRQLFSQIEFLKLWCSQAFSQIALQILNFALITKLYQLTHSTLAISFIWLFYFLPAIFLSPLGGILVDNFDKKKLLVFANFAQAGVVASYLFFHNHLYFTYLLVLAYSILNQVYLPAESAALPGLITPKLFPLANSLFLLTTQAAVVFGFGIGGVLLKTIGLLGVIGLAFWALVGAGIAVSLLPPDKSSDRKINLQNWLTNIGSQLVEVKHLLLYKQRELLLSFGLTLFLQVALITLLTVFPAFSWLVLRQDFQDSAPVLIPSLTIGIIIGTLWLQRRHQQIRKHLVIATGFLILGVSLIIAGWVLPQSVNHRLVGMVSVFLVLGFGGALTFLPTQTFLQEVTPPSFRGRIFSLLGVLVNLASLLPILFLASLVELIRADNFVGLAGCLFIVLGIYTRRHGAAIIRLATNHRS